jgi:hypothetical protein
MVDALLRRMMNSRRLMLTPISGIVAAHLAILEVSLMSALDQKQTYAVQKAMSALLPKATSNATDGDIR